MSIPKAKSPSYVTMGITPYCGVTKPPSDSSEEHYTANISHAQEENPFNINRGADLCF
jgi:hypothetical protein